MATKTQKAVIHILKEKYGITDKEYTDIMYDKFDVSSSIYLSEQQAESFIHLLNYTYSTDYKLGYDKAFDIFCSGQDNNTIAQNLYYKKYDRKMTDFETKCFNMLETEKQLDLIKQLY